MIESVAVGWVRSQTIKIDEDHFARRRRMGGTIHQIAIG